MSFDTVIKNGCIMDGIGKPCYRSDIGIHDGKIVKIDKNLNNALLTIDATNLLVVPGFIDMHSHSDMSIQFEPRQDSMIHQGITTQVIGNCGFSLAPINPMKLHLIQKQVDIFTPPGETIDITWQSFNQYLANIEKSGCALNVVPLVGFGTVRIAGGPAFEDRNPTSEELFQMKAYVEEAMRSGAIGLSTGLIYTPQIYAQTEEVIELAKVVAKYRGLYFSHMRNEGSRVVEAVKELIKIVETSRCAGGQISHHKVSGIQNWGTSKETLRLISDANVRGVNIHCDQYPYNRGMTSLVTVLPPWVHLGGIEKVLEHLSSSASRKKMKEDMIQGIERVSGYENWMKTAGPSLIYISSVKTNKWKDVQGKSLSEITALKNFADDYETLFDLLLEEEAEVMMTIELMGEEDIQRIMTNEYTMIGTDGWGVSPNGETDYGKPHPRFYGTYPRILGKYVREKGLMSLETAITKMTYLPAQKLGIDDRGVLKEGAWGDIVLFNPETIIDLATYDDPHKFPLGIHYVLVNGQIVVDNEELTDKLPGKVLRRKDDRNT